MKKSLIALAVLAASGAAMAQSSVTLFGIIDAGVGYVKADGAGHTTGLINGGNSTSRLGFRGTEDLGGGLAASFWLEGALNNDVGGGATQTTGFDFQRRSTVSLSGNFGEVRLGRDFAPTYLSLIAFDPFGQRGFGQIETLGSGTVTNPSGTAAGYVRNNNSVAYFLPATLGGFYGNVQYAFGERNSNQTATRNVAGFSTTALAATTNKSNNYLGGRIGYANGPLDVAGSYGQYADVVRTAAPGSYAQDYKLGNIGASYDFGVVKPMVLIQSEKQAGLGTVGDFKLNTYAIGATAPLGAGVLRAQVSRYDLKNSSNDANKFAIGYVYNLSKRTAVYADVARISNKGAAQYTFGGLGGSLAAGTVNPGGNVTGVAVGVKHSF
jgi:predicted porin